MKSLKTYYKLPKKYQEIAQQLPGPIMIFGAGGFIGVNALCSLLLYRDDVIGVSRDPKSNWRLLAAGVKQENLAECDITDSIQLRDLISKYKPQTIFNLSAYGAYSKQREYQKIYSTNFQSTIDLIEALKVPGFKKYIHAGSSSEYGLAAAAPKESDELIPNSHYALSKVAVSYAMKYYGILESLPVFHARFYSAYGPWEEPDRLIPQLIAKVRQGDYPPLVQPDISRDFIYITDIVTGLLALAVHESDYGAAFNIGTGVRTTIRELVMDAQKVVGLKKKASFGKMPNRQWDVTDWYANPEKAQQLLDWQTTTSLEEGLEKTKLWQEAVNYDQAFWNWTSQVHGK